MSAGKVGLTVTPWACQAEWQVVRDLVMARDIQAVKFIQVWGARVGRLPAGVETTRTLLVATTTPPHTPLTGHGRDQVLEPRLPPGHEHVGAE